LNPSKRYWYAGVASLEAVELTQQTMICRCAKNGTLSSNEKRKAGPEPIYHSGLATGKMALNRAWSAVRPLPPLRGDSSAIEQKKKLREGYGAYIYL
jgi:hypothetical protein